MSEGQKVKEVEAAVQLKPRPVLYMHRAHDAHPKSFDHMIVSAILIFPQNQGCPEFVSVNLDTSFQPGNDFFVLQHCKCHRNGYESIIGHG